MTKFVFVMAPPYSGSTVLFRLIETSAQVSALPGEGQFIAETKEAMRADPWNAEAALPWPDIRAGWEAYWDLSKPLLLEKSPPNMIRSSAIGAAFDPAYFIVLMREPYAHIEGLARRAHVPPMGLPRNAGRAQRIARAAELWLGFAQTQKETIDKRQHVSWLTYEDLCHEPERIANQLAAFLPELGELKIDARFGVHSVSGTAARTLSDMNEPKRRLLSSADFEIINDVLGAHKDVLACFGYSLREPAPDQDWIAAKAGLRNTVARAWTNLIKNLPGRGKTK